MFTQYSPDISAILGASLVGVGLLVAVIAGVFGVVIFLVYTVIWRAVRRGLREFHHPPVKRGMQHIKQFSGDPRAW